MTLDRHPQPIALICLMIIALLLVSGCTNLQSSTPKESITTEDTPDWFSIPLTDIQTQEEIQIRSLITQGRPIIIHTFTTSCPSCAIQLRESTDLQIKYPDTYTVIGINIDPGEGNTVIRQYIERNGYQGYFVTSPREFSVGLIETFGIQIMQSTPQTIVICDGRIYLIGSGAFSSEGLARIIGDLCP